MYQHKSVALIFSAIVSTSVCLADDSRYASISRISNVLPNGLQAEYGVSSVPPLLETTHPHFRVDGTGQVQTDFRFIERMARSVFPSATTCSIPH